MKKRGLQAPHNHLYTAKVLNNTIPRKCFVFFYIWRAQIFLCCFFAIFAAETLSEARKKLVGVLTCKEK